MIEENTQLNTNQTNTNPAETRLEAVIQSSDQQNHQNSKTNEPNNKRPTKNKEIVKKVSTILSRTCLVISAAALSYLILVLLLIMYFNAPNSYYSEDKRFVIESGMTFRQVVERLHQEKIVKHPTVFLYLSQAIKGLDPKVRYGEYFFEKNSSYYKILHKMLHGYIYFRKITVSEGLSTNSAIRIISRAPGLAGNLPDNLREGVLLPETYFYSFNDTKSSVIKRMQDSMSKHLNELWEKRDLNIPVKTKEQALILASIVEKETGIAEERPKVASVFTNRLRKSMKLQSDPTVIYSYAFGDKKLERPIRVSDLNNKSPFNTYYIFGLPPTPICNPGLESIKAVLNPPQTDYLYFVATGNKGHYFSATLAEHNSYVARYRNALRAKAEVPAQAAPQPVAQPTTESQ